MPLEFQISANELHEFRPPFDLIMRCPVLQIHFTNFTNNSFIPYTIFIYKYGIRYGWEASDPALSKDNIQ